MRVWFLLLMSIPALAQLPTCSAPLWSPCDLVFPLQAGEDAARAELRAEFRSPHRDTKTIRAFREGDTFVLRFTPDEVGEWDYRVTSSIKRFDAQTGKAAGTASNAVGFVFPANKHHFQTADLQPHLWMASAIDGFAAMPRAEFEAAVAARAAEKFTHIRVVIEPKDDLREAAERIRVIHGRGLTTDLVLGAIPDDRRERERYMTEIVARFGAFNLTWAGVPGYEKVRNSQTVLRDAGTLIAQQDAYKHPRTTMAEFSSLPLAGDRNGGWMDLLSYGTPDPNIGAVEHQLVEWPSVNTGIRSRADLWNATMNGQYPAAGSGRDFTAWFDFMSRTRYWEMEPYFDVTGGRAIAVRDVEVRSEEVIDAAEYVVYLEKPGPVTLTVQDKKYDVEWINPATAERVKAKDFKGKMFAGAPPDTTHDWILHVWREGHVEGLGKKYKFESRPVHMQSPETDSKAIPFEVESPVGEVSAKGPVKFSLKVTRATRATQNLLVVWTAELTTGAEGGRVVSTGREGTFTLPASFTDRLPAVISLRAAILNANGKVYVIDRVVRLVP